MEQTPNELYQQIFEHLPLGIKIWRLDRRDDPGSLRLVASNQAAAEATGVPVAEVLGKPIAESFPQAVPTGIAEAFAEVVRTGRMRDLGEVAYSDARVREGIYSVLAFPLPDDCVAVAFENITRRKLADVAHRRKDALERLRYSLLLAAHEAGGLEEACTRVMDLVCGSTGWPVGHVYQRSPEESLLVPTSLWHLRDPSQFQLFREVTEATPLGFGIGLPGRVWASRRAEWIVDLTLDDNFPRARTVRHIGLRAGFAFPVTVGGEIEVVLEFYSPDSRVPDAELMEILEENGRQLGRAVERERVRR